MFWLFRAAKRLRELGILGMNRRNAACILDHNPRALFPLVDDKLRMHHLCRRIGVRVPYWREVLEMSRRVAEAVGLGYIGVDIVVDVDHGPMLLEANARPGLAIQIANGQGLAPRLAAIDAMLDARPAVLRIDEAREAEPMRRGA